MRDTTREDEAMCRGIIAKFKRDRVSGRATFREQTSLWYAKSIEGASVRVCTTMYVSAKEACASKQKKRFERKLPLCIDFMPITLCVYLVIENYNVTSRVS